MLWFSTLSVALVIISYFFPCVKPLNVKTESPVFHVAPLSILYSLLAIPLPSSFCLKVAVIEFVVAFNAGAALSGASLSIFVTLYVATSSEYLSTRFFSLALIC